MSNLRNLEEYRRAILDELGYTDYSVADIRDFEKWRMMVLEGIRGLFPTADVREAVQDWLDDHPEATTTVEDGAITDAKLAPSGVKADVANLKSDSRQQGADNKTEFTEVEKSLYTTTAFVPTYWAGEVHEDGTSSDSTTRICSQFIPILPTRRFRISCDSGIKFRIFYYSSGDSESTFLYADEGWTYGSKIILNDDVSNFYIRIVVAYVDDRTVASIAALASTVTMNRLTTIALASENYVDTKVGDLYENVQQTVNLSIGYYWNVETSVAVKTILEGSVWMAGDPIPVAEGEKYIVSGDQGATHKTRIWILTDDSLNIISKAEDYYTTTEEVKTDTFTVPAGATKLLVCTRHDAPAPYALVYKVQSALDLVDEIRMSLKGKNLSLLGDSISAYAGTIPVGNDAYYDGTNSGVSSPNQMWWKVLCDRLGMTPLVINGYSGSGVTQLEDSDHLSKVPMSSDTRCGALHSGATNPDIILIAGGVNDYTYALSAQSEPLEWDGLTTPTLADSFTEAYACMIKKLQTNYPNAIVVALSTWFTMRGDDNGYTLTHTVGSNKYTQADYNNAIEYVAKQMHIPYIDVSNIGFNRSNMYPTYASDSSTIPTHPNANGQRVMGEAIANKLPMLVNGYLK